MRTPIIHKQTNTRVDNQHVILKKNENVERFFQKDGREGGLGIHIFLSAEKYFFEKSSGKFDVMHSLQIEKNSFMLIVELPQCGNCHQ